MNTTNEQQLFTKESEKCIIFKGECKATLLIRLKQNCLNTDLQNSLPEGYGFANLREIFLYCEANETSEEKRKEISSSRNSHPKHFSGALFLLIKQSTEITERKQIKYFLEQIHQRSIHAGHLLVFFNDKNKEVTATICKGKFVRGSFWGQIRHHGRANNVYDNFDIPIKSFTKIVDSRNR